MRVRRVKQGTPSTHPILGDELRALRRLNDTGAEVSFCVHLGARGTPQHRGVCPMVERAGVETELTFKAHPHMLRHACGYALANKGHNTDSKAISVTGISSTPFDTRSCRRRGLRIFGAIRSSVKIEFIRHVRSLVGYLRLLFFQRYAEHLEAIRKCQVIPS